MNPILCSLKLPLTVGAALLATLFLFPTLSSANTVCSERTSLLKKLTIKYGESRISSGLSVNGTIVEITKSKKGSWTMLSTNPTGLSCIISAGEHWRTLKHKKPVQ